MGTTSARADRDPSGGPRPRAPALRRGGSRFKHHALRFLPDDAARALLRSIAGDPVATRPGFDALVRHLDGHALALELAGAFLANFPGETPESYLALRSSGEEPDGEVSDQTRNEATVTASPSSRGDASCWGTTEVPV